VSEQAAEERRRWPSDVVWVVLYSIQPKATAVRGWQQARDTHRTREEESAPCLT
jgi:hypothetical protein